VGKLFFVFTAEFFNISDDSETGEPAKQRIDENRYYFENDQLLRWLNADKEKVAPDYFESAEIMYLDRAEYLQERIKQPG
jgi:hypothetical protein